MKYLMVNYNFYLKNIVIIWMLTFSVQSAYAESLYVFYPSTLRTQFMQKKLTNALPGIEIRVFGRYKDFKSKIKADSPEVILAKMPVIKRLKNYVPKLNGSRKNETKEPYVFLSVTENKKPNPNNMAGMTIGVFDILGRKGMKELVGNYFKPIPKLKRVSKMEDLLQLLTFNMVNAVLIPEIHVKYFKEISKLNFVITPVPKMQVGIISLAVRNNGNATNILKVFTNMNSKLKKPLGIDNLEEQ
ncbi:hypothetical protein QUF74_10075 [Candidatus Halobeggiatoa sp. HSG11]|nr:hypothetical protein [Candidatus Halobeggiatoa sp. HSG11]